MRNTLIRRRGFAKRRTVCPRSLRQRLRRSTIEAMRAARRGELMTVGPEGLLASLNKDDPGFAAEARRQGRIVSASYKDDEDIAWWLGPE